ncbi:MAG TPA: alpha/beta fold hydrolase [Ktedonobacterales bacterium]|nr:alpha/beta fold hydrolase [Ktedonobacterales bacterium]
MGLIRTLRRGATWAVVGGAAGALAVTTRYLLETPQPLESKLLGEQRIDRGHGGDIYYNVAGPEDAEPLVLLHDLYPGASNYEYRMVFLRLAATRRVYAPDWLGFGMSERPQVAYTGEFYAGALGGFLRDTVGRPAVVVAHGHSANIAVRTASDAPALFERLVLVAPNAETIAEQPPRLSQTAVRTAQRVALGLVPYALLSSRPALRWLSLVRSAQIGEGASSDDSVQQRYASAHQFGGQHAVLALLTGELDLPMGNALAVLEAPLLIVSGDRDRRHPPTAMEDLAVLHPRAVLEVIPNAGESVCEDAPEAFARAISGWLAMPQSRHVLDESALLPQTLPSGQLSGASGPRTQATGATGASEDEIEPRDAEHAEAMPGSPGYVVPGVSDMGLDGPAAVTVGDITTLEPELTLGPEEPESPVAGDQRVSEGEGDEMLELLPEAGAAAPEDSAEQGAREGDGPPTEPDANSADVAEAARDLAVSHTADDTLAGPGDVAGLAHVVQTPDAVEMPAEEVSSADVSPAANSPEAPARQRAQQSTRTAPREPSPRTQRQTEPRTEVRGRAAKKSAGQTKSSQRGQASGKRQAKGRSST